MEGMALTSLIIGILSLLTGAVTESEIGIGPFTIATLVLAVVGIITGILGIKSSKKGFAKAGLIMSILMLIGGIAYIVVTLVSNK